MGRPRHDPNAKPRRDEILDRATRLFAERGYEGTSMADVAARAGIGKASLFYHFASKDDLYAAVLERLVTAVVTAIAVAAGDAGDFVSRLDALSDAMTMTLGAQPFAARLLVREVMDGGPIVRGALGEQIQLALATAETFLRAGRRAGVFTDLEPKQLIVTLLGIHFMPFAVARVVERFVGVAPFDGAFVEARRAAVRGQVRALLLVDILRVTSKRSSPRSSRRTAPGPARR